MGIILAGGGCAPRDTPSQAKIPRGNPASKNGEFKNPKSKPNVNAFRIARLGPEPVEGGVNLWIKFTR